MARPREFEIETALDAAMQAFWTHGYEATSMADLMQAMDLQKGSIYKAFGNKHQLFVAALQRYLDQSLLEIQEAFERGATPGEGLRRILVEYVGPLCREQPVRRGCFAMNTVSELGPHDPHVVGVIDRHFARLKGMIVQVIEQGQQAGEFRTDQPAQALAELFLVVTAGLLASTKGPMRGVQEARVADLVLENLKPPG